MLSTLNSSLVSLGYEAVDSIVKENYQIWYEIALKKGVPANVLDVILKENNITADVAMLKLTKNQSIDCLSYIHNDNGDNTHGLVDNSNFRDTFLSYHNEKSASLGATSVSIQEGKVNYHFGQIPLGVTRVPVGIVGLKSLTSANDVISVGAKENLLELSQKVMLSSRPLIVILGHNKKQRAEYLSSLLLSQGATVKTLNVSKVDDDFISELSDGYTIALFESNGFSDFLTMNIKGRKEKADQLSQVWNASSSEIILPELCTSCSAETDTPAISIQEKGFSLSVGKGRMRNAPGCNHCYKGYTGTFSIFELFSTVEDRKMVELISSIGVKDVLKSEYTKVQSEFSSKGLQHLYNLLEKKIQNGQVSVNDAKRTLL